MSARPCTGCGRTIEWAKTPSGKAVPLERVPVVEIDPQGVALVTGRTVLVNHFKCCPKANDFSGRNRTTPAQHPAGGTQP